jgi:Lon protease-like protein
MAADGTDRGNRDIPLSGDPRVDAALLRIRDKFADIYDAWIVQAEIERKQTRRLDDHAQWLLAMQEQQKRHELNMRKIEEKLDALINIVDRLGRAGAQ